MLMTKRQRKKIGRKEDNKQVAAVNVNGAGYYMRPSTSTILTIFCGSGGLVSQYFSPGTPTGARFKAALPLGVV